MKVMNGLDLQAQKIINLADPSANADAANKQYVDNVARGLAWKAPVRSATTTNVTVAAPGASLDGVALTANDRVLLKNQATAAQNGIYLWAASGSPLVRAVDADTAGELAPGTAVSVAEGPGNGAVAQAGGGVSVGAGGIALDASIAARKYSASVGNGSATSIAVTHGLGTKDVAVTLRQNADDAGV